MIRLRTRRLRAILSEYFELFLTTVGVLVAIGGTFTELPGGEKGLALTFLVWLQGFILWAVHRHNWFRRRARTALRSVTSATLAGWLRTSTPCRSQASSASAT